MIARGSNPAGEERADRTLAERRWGNRAGADRRSGIGETGAGAGDEIETEGTGPWDLGEPLSGIAPCDPGSGVLGVAEFGGPWLIGCSGGSTAPGTSRTEPRRPVPHRRAVRGLVECDHALCFA